MSAETEIQPNHCLKCGSEAIVREQFLSPILKMDGLGSEFIVSCGGCERHGEWKYDRAEAIAVWNEMNPIKL